MPWDEMFRDDCKDRKADGIRGYPSPLFLAFVVWSICHSRLLSSKIISLEDFVNG